MYLSRAEIRNYRGIRHLKVDFEEESTVLIGENSWGKTSLLRALWTVLGQGPHLCRFSAEDLYVPVPLLGENEQDDTGQGTMANSASPAALPAPPRVDEKESGTSGEGASSNRVTVSRPFLDLSATTAAAIFPKGESKRLKRNLKKLKSVASTSTYYRREYEFRANDVYQKNADELSIELWFCESPGTERQLSNPLLRKYWICCSDNFYRLHWLIKAHTVNGEFVTEHLLLGSGRREFREGIEPALQLIISLNPVLRMRDHRMLTREQADKETGCAQTDAETQKRQVAQTYLSVLKGLSAAEQSDLRKDLLTLSDLVSQYLTNYSLPQISGPRRSTRSTGDAVSRPISLETMSTLRDTLNEPGINKTKLLTTLLAGAMTLSGEGRDINWQERPIVIFEDIEARFHPSLLLSFWSVVESVNVQKIVTTNSGELLSAIPLTSLRRLHRRYYDTRSYQVDLQEFSTDDMRRIAFHLRLNRPMTLFSRCWLLVEGETEIWMISQMAAMMGISLQCNGVRPIEFAQCGLGPLIKLARQLGIAYHVLTDGDDAGLKYAQMTSRYVALEQLDDHLTVLPSSDIEHFFYYNGFDRTYQRASGMRGPYNRKGLTADRIIELAIKKKSKPGMALAVIAEMQERGSEAIPELFMNMLNKITLLSHGDYF